MDVVPDAHCLIQMSLEFFSGISVLAGVFIWIDTLSSVVHCGLPVEVTRQLCR